MNSKGATIPTAWLMIIPIVNIYWIYKYAEGYSAVLKKDDKKILWFLLFWLIGIVTPALVQIELNKSSSGATVSEVAPAAAKPVVA